MINSNNIGLFMEALSPADHGAVSIVDGFGREGRNVQLWIGLHDRLFPLSKQVACKSLAWR